ncbi:hypothetical protein PUV54_15040 [Hyphococcus flavus]|uniref:Uncharacterized protein n=1 Tax=Hyphococcus flavus TaxID=1866326 RepID=A0AAE9ZCZ9_9PROT|nr:hypothetical protein [Hyphococcus flavus]WDI31265.1 hypothetical protein PUV54_15040 [Hyphococcus flavus]
MTPLAVPMETAVFEAELERTVKADKKPELTLVETGVEPKTNASLHAGVFRVFALINAAILAVFWLTFRNDREALFMVAISAVYLGVYLGTPYMLSRVGGRIDPVQKKPFAQFLAQPFETWTGVISGREALLQITLVPAAILIAVTGMGVIIGVSR